MLPRMMAENRTNPSDSSQAGLTEAFERRVVDVFVWLLADEPSIIIGDERPLTDSVDSLR